MNRLEAWRLQRGLTYQQLAERMGLEHPTVVRRWCLHPSHQSFVEPSDENKMRIQQMTLGSILPSYWLQEANSVASRKNSKGGRNGRQQQR